MLCFSVSPWCTSKGERRKKDWTILNKSALEMGLQFWGEHSYRISPLLAAKTPSRPTLHHQSDNTVALLVGNPVKQLVWKNKACVSFPKKKDKAFFFPLQTFSIFFPESVIKAFFSFCITVSPCNLAVQPELMNINGWLSIPFVKKHIQCRGG